MVNFEIDHFEICRKSEFKNKKFNEINKDSVSLLPR